MEGVPSSTRNSVFLWAGSPDFPHNLTGPVRNKHTLTRSQSIKCLMGVWRQRRNWNSNLASSINLADIEQVLSLSRHLLEPIQLFAVTEKSSSKNARHWRCVKLSLTNVVTKIWGINWWDKLTLVCTVITERVLNRKSFAKMEKYLGAPGQKLIRTDALAQTDAAACFLLWTCLLLKSLLFAVTFI